MLWLVADVFLFRGLELGCTSGQEVVQVLHESLKRRCVCGVVGG